MFSRAESKKLRQEFWTSFGRSYPRKWMLYNTKLKELQLKFSFSTEKAQVALEISASDETVQAYYWEKIWALRSVLTEEYLPEAVFEEAYLLPEGKEVSRVYVQLDRVNIHRKSDWPQVQDFLQEKMDLLERFFLEFEDYIKS